MSSLCAILFLNAVDDTHTATTASRLSSGLKTAPESVNEALGLSTGAPCLLKEQPDIASVPLSVSD